MTWRTILAVAAAFTLAAILCPRAAAQTPPVTPAATPAPAQQSDGQPPPQPDGPIHTLHVYMDLIQVPVLILDNELQRMKPLDASKFLLSLDSGPTFRPRHVRQQGDDPITLGILLEPNAEPDVMPKIDAAISALAPNSLHPSDHVTIYGLDCGLVRSANDIPADPATLKIGVQHAIAAWTERRKIKHPEPCDKRVNLWDAMTYVVDKLSQLPGRRVLLAVTDGNDHGSTRKWNDLFEFAQLKGVAIFGYAPPANSMGGRSPLSTAVATNTRMSRSGPASLPLSIDGGISPENPFISICQLSGGMVMPADPPFMPNQLVKFTTFLRERYIIEFSRARNDTPGEHNILITLRDHPTAYIRPAGVSIMLPDPAVANDPNTIPRDTTDAPEIGNRKPIKIPK